MSLHPSSLLRQAHQCSQNIAQDEQQQHDGCSEPNEFQPGPVDPGPRQAGLISNIQFLLKAIHLPWTFAAERRVYRDVSEEDGCVGGVAIYATPRAQRL